MSANSQIPLERIDSVRAFNRFYTQRIGVLGAGLLHSKYTLTELRVLYEIGTRESPSATDLVRDLGLDPGYLSRILATFEKRGWLKRVRSKEDARKSFLRLTESGRKVRSEFERRSREEIAVLLEPLDPEQQMQLQGHLESVQALMGRAPRRSEAAGASITLREHRPGDIGWIIQMHGRLYEQEFGWGAAFEALVAEIGASFLRNFDPERERCWIAERDGVRVGSVMLVRHTNSIAKLRLLLVDPSQRGMGIGKQLVAECIRFAREVGYRKITLWTQSILRAARRIYEEQGFELVKTEPHDVFGVKLVGETWELKLG
jgi:DNA-binding MarR family transcriptional regulator/GNAT superfamily N-acetyltransferase